MLVYHCMVYIYISILILFIPQLVVAQKNHEIGFISENDLYVSLEDDKYYTNGIELYYNHAKKSSWFNFDKKIKSVKIGQKIYNPQYYDIENIKFQHRPYAGYLYICYTEKFTNPKNIFAIGVEFGLTGKNSKAEETQNFVHQFYDKIESKGWDTQIKEKKSIGLLLTYIYSLYYKPEKKWQLSLINSSQVNFIFTNLSSGIALKFNLSRFNTSDINNTTFFSTSLQAHSERWNKESYLGFKTYLTYQIEDFTITGDISQNKNNVQFHLKPLVWYINVGYYLNLKHWNFNYQYYLHTPKSQEIIDKYIKYGAIAVAYKF